MLYLALIPVLLLVAAVLVVYGLQLAIVTRRSLRNATSSQRKFLSRTLWMISTVCGFVTLAVAIAVQDDVSFGIPQVFTLFFGAEFII